MNIVSDGRRWRARAVVAGVLNVLTEPHRGRGGAHEFPRSHAKPREATRSHAKPRAACVRVRETAPDGRSHGKARQGAPAPTQPPLPPPAQVVAALLRAPEGQDLELVDLHVRPFWAQGNPFVHRAHAPYPLLLLPLRLSLPYRVSRTRRLRRGRRSGRARRARRAARRARGGAAAARRPTTRGSRTCAARLAPRRALCSRGGPDRRAEGSRRVSPREDSLRARPRPLTAVPATGAGRWRLNRWRLFTLCAARQVAAPGLRQARLSATTPARLSATTPARRRWSGASASCRTRRRGRPPLPGAPPPPSGGERGIFQTGC